MEGGKISLRHLQDLNDQMICLEQGLKQNGRNGKFGERDLDYRSAKRKRNELDPRDPRNKKLLANQEKKPAEIIPKDVTSIVGRSREKTHPVPQIETPVEIPEKLSPVDFLFRPGYSSKTTKPLQVPVATGESNRPSSYKNDEKPEKVSNSKKSTEQKQRPVYKVSSRSEVYQERAQPNEPVIPVFQPPARITIHPYQDDNLEPLPKEKEHIAPVPVPAALPVAPEPVVTYQPPRNTHSSELMITPEETNIHVLPYEPRPFAQHFIIPVTGYLCKVCDRFFCTSDDAHLRHCSSMEHYDLVCRRVAPPPPRPYHRPDMEPFRPRENRREFVIATLDNYKTFSYMELNDNLIRRGLDIEGDRQRLLVELEKLLRIESANPNAAGYFLIDVEENDVTSRKYKWFAEFEMRKIISELPGVILVIECNKRSLECKNGKRFVWTISVLMANYFPEKGITIDENKVLEFQGSEMHVELARRLLNLKAFKRESISPPISSKIVSKNYIEIDQ